MSGIPQISALSILGVTFWEDFRFTKIARNKLIKTNKCLLYSTIYIISSVMHAFWLVLTYNLLEDKRIDDVIIKTFYNSDKNWYSDTLGCASYATFLFLPPFDVICDLLLNRHTATRNLFVLYDKELKYSLEICMVEGSLKAHVFFSKYCPLIAKCIIFRVYTTVIYLKWEEYKLRILKIGWFLKTVWMKPQTSI